MNDWSLLVLLRFVVLWTLSLVTLALFSCSASDCTKNPSSCSHNWYDGLTAGAGLTYEMGHARIDLRYQVFTNAPFDGALLFTMGVTP